MAISGLLATLLMVGWSARVNTERYRDSVVTLQSFMQQQYNLVYNVENERAGNLQCSRAATPPSSIRVDEVDSDAIPKKGQSNCVLLGRFLTITSDGAGSRIEVQAVLGMEPDSSPAPGATVADILRQYRATPITQSIGLSDSSLQVPWGATVVDGDNNPRSLTVAIIRSPLGGKLASTFAANGEVTLATLLDEPSSQDTQMCLDPGAVFAGGQRAVILKAGASAQSAVETREGC